MQPLMLALQFVGYHLHDLIEHGGYVIDLDPNKREPAGVLSMFRRLMCRPGDPPSPDPVFAKLDAELALAKRRHQESDDGTGHDQ